MQKIISVCTLATCAVALCALASVAGTANAASTRAACTDRGFRTQARISVNQLSRSLDWFQLKGYASAEAWSLRSWRTIRATAPCWGSYRRYRSYELKDTAAVWNAVRFARRGDHASAERQLGQAERWGDLAAAEQATWP